VISLWVIFEKSGEEGWKSIVPIYNIWVLAEIAGKSGWIGILAVFIGIIPLFGPIISLAIFAYIYYDLAQSFDRGMLFTMGMIFLPFIFFPILAFGAASYK
jgi:hypothetical protein